VEDESPWVGPGPQSFCSVFGLVNFFVGNFFLMWAFLTLAHMGQGQIDTSKWDKLNLENKYKQSWNRHTICLKRGTTKLEFPLSLVNTSISSQFYNCIKYYFHVLWNGFGESDIPSEIWKTKIYYIKKKIKMWWTLYQFIVLKSFSHYWL